MFGVIPARDLEKMLVPEVGNSMREDAFCKYHPATELLFFAGAIISTVLLQHPVYLISNMLIAIVYYLLLNGRKGIRIMVRMVPLFIFIALFNPIVNTRGNTILFLLFGRPYTLEALIYGVVVAATFVVMILWLGCYNKVVTGDKFICLFGNVIPSVSLLLVMVLRMIPNLMRKATQIMGARSCIGKGAENALTVKDKLISGTTVLGVLTSWSLEGSVVTGDSMKARGYGTAKRTNFMVYSMKRADWCLILIMLLFVCVVGVFAMKGCMYADFLQERNIARVNGINSIGFGTYIGFLMIPIVLNIKETLQWNISKYKI